MRKNKIISIVAILLTFSLLTTSCEILQDIMNASSNLKRLQFKVAGVSNFQIGSTGISNKDNISNFGLSDIASFVSNVKNKRFPVSFILNIDAKNPNDGTGGAPSTKSSISAMPWDLYVNETKTISGGLANSVHVPGTGETVTIPLRISFDFLEFFADKGYKDLVNLALAIGGKDGSASQIKLKAQPVVSTSLGNIKYPGKLTIASKEWTN